MEIDAGDTRKDNLSGKKPHEVVLEDEQAVNGTGTAEENLETWVKWKGDTAREIARLTEKNEML